MKKHLACCGFDCGKCDVFRAETEEEKNEVTRKWSKKGYPALAPAEVFCDGCKAVSGKLFRYCKECKIRKCVFEKEIKSCMDCDDYPCGYHL